MELLGTALAIGAFMAGSFIYESNKKKRRVEHERKYTKNDPSNRNID